VNFSGIARRHTEGPTAWSGRARLQCGSVGP
jgi:hypothetical protein